MFHLAIESSTRRASVALLHDENLIGTRSLETSVATSAALIPEVQNLFSRAGRSLNDMELVSVSAGPGSFTGLRIGVMAAKALAWATGARLVGVESHRVVAWQAAKAIGLETGRAPDLVIASLIPAQRGEWFARVFRYTKGDLVPLGENRIVGPDGLDSLHEGSLFFSGPALEGAGAATVPRGTGRIWAPQSSWHPLAESVGILGLESWRRGDFSDPWRLVPIYGRPSAAEEKMDAARQE